MRLNKTSRLSGYNYWHVHLLEFTVLGWSPASSTKSDLPECGCAVSGSARDLYMIEISACVRAQYAHIESTVLLTEFCVCHFGCCFSFVKGVMVWPNLAGGLYGKQVCWEINSLRSCVCSHTYVGWSRRQSSRDKDSLKTSSFGLLCCRFTSASLYRTSAKASSRFSHVVASVLQGLDS